MDRDEVRARLTGRISHVRVPFNQDGSIDDHGVRSFIDASIAGGAVTIALTAGDSHYYCLTDDEIAHLTKVTVEQTAGRAMVVAADYFYSTDRALQFAEFVRDVGADVYMLLPPVWGGCTPADLAQHYIRVGEVMPVMVVTAVFANLSDGFALTTLKLMLEQSDRVVAIKDDRGGTFVLQMCLENHERCAIYCGGQKRNHLAMVPFGCDGYMSSFIPFKPEIPTQYWKAVQTQDFVSARRIVADYDVPLFDYALNSKEGWNCVFHGLLEVYGVAKRWKRPPYTSLDDEGMERLRGFLRDHHLL